MVATVAFLYVAALVLEAAGLWLTIVDLRAAQRRLRDYLSLPTTLTIAPAWMFANANDATVVTSGGTLEERMEKLEQWRQEMPAVLSKRDDRLRDQMQAVLDGVVSAQRATLDERFQGLRQYVASQADGPSWYAYRGPGLLVVGLIIGFLGNILALPTQ